MIVRVGLKTKHLIARRCLPSLDELILTSTILRLSSLGDTPGLPAIFFVSSLRRAPQTHTPSAGTPHLT